MTNFHDAFAQLMQVNVTEETGTPSSLFDFINAHKNALNNEDEEIKSLSDLTSKHLKLQESNNTSANYFVSSFENSSKQTCDKEPSQFSTLEEYSKSFFATTDSNISSIPNVNEDKSSIGFINERLANIKVSSEEQESRKIDLTAALLGKNDINFNSSTFVDDELNNSFNFPLKECFVDIKSLVEKEIKLSSTEASHFCFVISRQWKKLPLPKKCWKIERKRPYNSCKAFKFDTPSPDDLVLQSRNKRLTE